MPQRVVYSVLPPFRPTKTIRGLFCIPCRGMGAMCIFWLPINIVCEYEKKTKRLFKSTKLPPCRLNNWTVHQQHHHQCHIARLPNSLKLNGPFKPPVSPTRGFYIEFRLLSPIQKYWHEMFCASVEHRSNPYGMGISLIKMGNLPYWHMLWND